MAGFLEKMVSEQAQKIAKQVDEKMVGFEKNVTARLDKIDARLGKIEGLLGDRK